MKQSLPIYRKYWLLLLSVLISNLVLAQAPANDDCTDAAAILLDADGFGVGTFTSDAYDISDATVQTGETFAPAIVVASQNQKSIWYKFTLSTTRSIRVKLMQPGSAITAGDAGFAVYKTEDCLPTGTDISSKLTPIITFGNTYHPCVEPGEYLVQVSSKLAASGSLYIEVEAGATDALYDNPESAYEFGTLVSKMTVVNYNLSCQSLEDADEICDGLGTYETYNKSTWHTFTTPDYLDYLGLFLSSNGTTFPSTQKIGFRLYEGDATAGLSGLTEIGSCDSMMTNGYYPGRKMYECGEIEPSTTYTLQLFFPTTFDADIRVAVAYGGTDSTLAPVPVLSAMADENKLGILATSTTGTTYYDYLACNSKHSLYDCGPVPDTGILFGSVRYNLSTFYTFEITETAKLNLTTYSAGCSNALVSIYKGGVTEDCNYLNSDSLLSRTTYSAALNCLEPGKYTIQISGRDSGYYTSYLYGLYYGHLYTGADYCLRDNLGKQVSTTLTLAPMVASNEFDLSVAGAFDSINDLDALVPNTSYLSTVDTFGCGNTVIPEGGCGDDYKKVMYRQFEIADSGLVSVTNLNWSYDKFYKLYYGDANALAIDQDAHAYPDSISGLDAVGTCVRNYSYYTCLLPGDYTFATFGNDNLLFSTAAIDQPRVEIDTMRTVHYSLATAEDLGSIVDSVPSGAGTVYSTWDNYTCTDNADTIAGTAPCSGYKKAIYRQFYLSEPAMVSINNSYYSYGISSLFKGKATDGEDGLEAVATCFYSRASAACTPMDTGWYTVVSYGTGPSYENPEYSSGAQGYVHFGNQIYITITVDCEAPEFNRPHKAATDAGSPYLVEWNSAADTGAYPVTRNSVTLPTEHFNCIVDTPFSAHGLDEGCATAHNRVAYYVFELTQESYVQISTSSRWAKVYDFDVRTDSMSMATSDPLQVCTQDNGHIEFCKAQPGVYTLVITGGDELRCGSVSPVIYVDKVGYSRFDHAVNAYDFGVVPADSTYYDGAVGDVNPLNAGRAASNDFFYCTTGAQSTDPTEAACYVTYNPNIYTDSIWQVKPGSPVSYMSNSASRRNLWYTFVTDKAGWITVKVDNKTAGRLSQYQFSVYGTDADGTIDFETLIASGDIDSTNAQGLEYINANNASAWYCVGSNTIRFYRQPCNASPADRYYVKVDNLGYHYYADWHNMQPNHQVEVSVMVDSVDNIGTAFDHYASAGNIGIISADTFYGAEDNYSCATTSGTEPTVSYTYCDDKTLWYKFEVPEYFTGQVNYRLWVDSAATGFTPNDVQLFRENIAGDSTSTGLTEPPYGYSYLAGGSWGVSCVSSGTYYLLLTGCGKIDQDVYPQLIFTESAGDYCSAPVVAAITGVGSTTASVTVNCHTIGTDYGEFGPELTCPDGGETDYYKSSWFRIDITGTDTMDVTAYLTESTNAAPAQIKYRMMTGDCGAMQEQSCVMDALTENTYKCLMPDNSYYIQVLVPKYYYDYVHPSYMTTGDITLNLSAIVHEDTCAPVNPCMANANFVAEFDCNLSDSVRFVNYSTYGSSITYEWDFGFGSVTSDAVSPAFYYPALATDATYTVSLNVNNTACDGSATATQTITIPARPSLNLGNDTLICTGDTLVLNATSHTGSTYLWNGGSTDAMKTITTIGISTHWVQVTYDGCSKTDTIQVYISPLEPQPVASATMCDADSIQLVTYTGYSPAYTWSNGATTYNTWVYDAGTYWVDRTLNGCTVRDSFIVTNPATSSPLGNDTSYCFGTATHTLDATTAGATSYLWNDGASGASKTISTGGVYSVAITVGSCTINDTISIEALPIPSPVITGDLSLCTGDTSVLTTMATYSSYTWSSGGTTASKVVTTAGTHSVTVTNADGCSATSPSVTVVVNPLPTVIITGNNNLCFGESTILSATAGMADYDWSTGASTASITTATGGTYTVTATNALGCSNTASRTVTIGPPPTSVNRDTVTCAGANVVLPSGAIISTTGIYHDTVTNVNGCDSFITEIDLTVNPLSSVVFSHTLCSNELPYVWNGISVTTGGATAATFTTTASGTGCDSTTTLNLTVNPTKSATQSVTICADQLPYTWNGNSITAGGAAAGTFTTASLVTGCDSVTTLNLTVNPLKYTTLNIAVCNNDLPYVFGGENLSAAGIYLDTATAGSGCDSIITLNLTINNIDSTDLTVALCATELPYTFNGAEINESGTYLDTLSTSLGCDSFIVLDFTVLPILFDTLVTEICQGESYEFNDVSYNISGSYTHTFTSSNGCDSFSVLDLTVKPLPDAPEVVSPVNYCIGATATPLSATGEELQWYNTLTGGTGSTTTPTPTTTIAVSDTFYVAQLINGCEGPRSRIIVNVSEKPVASFVAEPLEIKCSGEEVTVTFTGTLPEGSTMIWEWSGGDVSGSDPGPYTVSWGTAGEKTIALWIDNGGCPSDTASVTIGITATPELPEIVMPPYACVGEAVQISGSSDAAGTLTYNWNVAGEEINDVRSLNMVWETAGQKIVALMVSSFDCPSVVRYDTIDIIDYPEVDIKIASEIVCQNDTVTLMSEEYPGYSYVWSPEMYFKMTSNEGHQVNAQMIVPGMIRLDVTDSFGCKASDSILVNTQHCCVVLVPNAFSPNGDGLNDRFELVTDTEQEINEFSIFNRWGERVFVSYKTRGGWDGTFRDKPSDLGTYHYYLRYTCSDGTQFVKKGDITLVR